MLNILLAPILIHFSSFRISGQAKDRSWICTHTLTPGGKARGILRLLSFVRMRSKMDTGERGKRRRRSKRSKIAQVPPRIAIAWKEISAHSAAATECDTCNTSWCESIHVYPCTYTRSYTVCKRGKSYCTFRWLTGTPTLLLSLSPVRAK